MAPFIVLLVIFILAILGKKIYNKYSLSFAGRLAMSSMLAFTAIGHFIFSEGMALMIPPFIPFREGLVIFTGLIEIAAAIGLLLPRTSRITSWLLILFFIMVLPANIYAAMEQVSYVEADFNGPGVTYLWFRIPLQLIFILWVYYFGVCLEKKSGEADSLEFYEYKGTIHQ
jgi:uncharacterized membrane protein